MDNRQTAHNFFYNESGRNSNGTMTFNNNIMYSYATAVARICDDGNGGKITLVSDDNFSTTTSKHISIVCYASPYSCISAFFRYEGDGSARELTKHNIKILELASESKLTQTANREQFATAYNALNAFKNLPDFKNCKKQITAALKKHKAIMDALNDAAALKALNAKRAAAAKKAAARAAAKRAAILKRYSRMSICEQARAAYSPDSPLESDAKTALRDALNPNRDLSFVWIDGDFIKTSQMIRVPVTDAARLLTLWRAGKLKHGETIDRYTVLKVGDDIVKIGCHNIPVANLQALNI